VVAEEQKSKPIQAKSTSVSEAEMKKKLLEQAASSVVEAKKEEPEAANDEEDLEDFLDDLIWEVSKEFWLPSWRKWCKIILIIYF